MHLKAIFSGQTFKNQKMSELYGLNDWKVLEYDVESCISLAPGRVWHCRCHICALDRFLPTQGPCCLKVFRNWSAVSYCSCFFGSNLFQQGMAGTGKKDCFNTQANHLQTSAFHVYRLIFDHFCLAQKSNPFWSNKNHQSWQPAYRGFPIRLAHDCLFQAPSALSDLVWGGSQLVHGASWMGTTM